MFSHAVRLLLPLLLILAMVGSAEAAPPTSAEITRAVEQLADDNFATRESASAFLWRAGRAAEAALEKAAESKDAEQAYRAAAVLAKFRLGIYPDTPPEVVAMIHQFNAGDLNSKSEVVRKLAAGNHIVVLLALLRGETNEEQRKHLVNSIGRDNMDKVLAQLIAQRNFVQAEQYLQLSALGGNGLENYAVYLILQGKANDEIARLRGVPGRPRSAVDARLLFHLFKIKGDLPAARAVAEEMGDKWLLEEVYFAQRDWNALCQRRLAPAAAEPRADRSLDELSFDAAYFRLAGRTREFQQAVAALTTRASAKPNEGWYCCEALLMNDRIGDAVEIFKKTNTLAAFKVLGGRAQFREAFALAGIEVPVREGSVSLDRLQKKSIFTNGTLRGNDRFPPLMAKVLVSLGEKEQALDLYAQLTKSPGGMTANHRRELAKALLVMGLEKEAFEQADLALQTVEALKRIAPTAVISDLFGKRTATAEVCWNHLRQRHPEESPAKTLARLRQIVLPKRRELADDGEFKQWVSEIEKVNPEAPGPLGASHFTAVGELYTYRNNVPQARKYFQLAATMSPDGQIPMRVADLYAAEEKWKEAADWYQRAADARNKPPLALYLRGWALTKAGDAKEGEALMKLARLLPLGNPQSRHELAGGLANRKLNEAAIHEWELLTKLGSINDWHANDACKHLGNASAETEPLKAADCWEQLALSALLASSAFTEVEVYLQLPHLIHKARARGLMAAGNHADAVRELWLSHAALPGDGKLVLDLAPEFRKARLDKTADELFERVYTVIDGVTQDFPNSAHHHNQAAWLAARCGRRLDEALKHANEAVRLVPDNPAYLDTLAEVHFARGDKQLAIELERRCLKLAPGDPVLEKQLQRFEAEK